MADPFGPEDDPFVLLERWLAQARESGSSTAYVMTLATATPDGQPSVRNVLLRGLDERGLVFYTNYESRKGRELASNPFGAVAFYWQEVHRQVTATGRVERVPRSESEAYWATRPRENRLAATASRQSEALPGPEELEQAFDRAVDRFPDDVPLPSFWGGFVLRPQAMEFWLGRERRLHHRIRFTRDPLGGWIRQWLFP
jgi:pyridoxamine 5'-phosphate oxidase